MKTKDVWNAKKSGPIVRARADGLCERCGREGHTLHHRKNRSQGGTWSPDNVVLLCGDGTQLCHGFVTVNPAVAHLEGFHVKSYENPVDIPIRPIYLHGRTRFTLADGTYADEAPNN